jgi:competence protein ComEC
VGAGAVPLFLTACFFSAGVVAARALYLPPARLLVTLAASIVLCVFAALRAHRIAWLPMALVWVVLGAWCAEMEPQPAPSPTLLTLSDGLLRTVEGTVTSAGPIRTQTDQSVEEATAEPPSQRIDLRLSSIEFVDDKSDRQIPVSGAVRLTVKWPQSIPRRIRCGERVRAVARLLPPETYHDAGVWNRSDYLLDEGITSTASLNVDRVELQGDAEGTSLACRLHEAQHAVGERLLALPVIMRGLPAPLHLSPDDAVMLSALVTGDRTFLAHSLRVGFERTGSFHMLVVSGLHLAIVAGCILWLARRLRIPRVPATLITIAASFAYALLTGFAAPVQRSLWMVTLYLIGRLVYRDRNVLNTIGFAALCLMVASPRAIFDSSLQMTLLAVIAIGGIAIPFLGATIHPYVTATRQLRRVALDVKLAPRLAQFRVTLRMIVERLRRAAGRRIAWRIFPGAVRLVLRVAEALVVSIAIELAMMLPMSIWFHRITFFALPVNLLILPLLLLLLPAALLTCVVLLAWPAAAVLPGMLVAVLLHFGVGMVHLFGSLRWGDLRIPSPALWQVALFWALLGAAIALMRFRRRWTRTSAWAALLLAGIIAIVPHPVQHPRNALFVEAIDVGQGDSILLITPEGKTLLIDGGGLGGGPRQASLEFDIGEEVVSAALWSRGIRHLDAVALTHAHSDHMGGLPAILRNFHPAELWVGNNPPIAAYNGLLDEARELHANVRTLRAGDAFELGSARVRVLAPFADYAPGSEPSNNDSLVLHVAYGATSVLLEGDAEAPVERGMLAESGLQSTLLKVGHHGSTTSTTPEFLARVAPQWAVISCGLRNRYGHPRDEVLRALQFAGVHTLSTDINGAACFRLDGVSVQPDPSCRPDSAP